MNPPSKKQLEFFTVIIVICMMVSVAVLFLDFGIKTAILEESLKLRSRIEEWENERKRETTTDRASNDSAIDPPIPGPVLVDNPTGMETGRSNNGSKRSPNHPAGRRRTQPNGPNPA